LETLSPTLISIFFITPSNGDGISTLDLSLSRVMSGWFLLILSPYFIKTSMTSTFLKSLLFFRF